MTSDSSKLAATIDHAEWAWLEPHAQRGILIIVSLELDLLTVGQQMVADEKEAVAQYINKGLLTKPTQAQLDSWNLEPTRKFLSIIVQPYVLIQDVSSH